MRAFKSKRVIHVPQKLFTSVPTSTLERGFSRVQSGRCGTPKEIAKMIVFLATTAAYCVTGETSIADGGHVR